MDATSDMEGLDFATIWSRYGESYGYARAQRGDIRPALVLRVSANEITLDIGSKQDAIVASQDLDHLTPEEIQAIEPGAEIPVYVLRTDATTGHVLVSIHMAKQQADWQRATELAESGEVVATNVVGFNRGGLLTQFGRLQGFLPGSQILHGTHLDQHGDLAAFVGQELMVKVIEVNQSRRRLVLSERAAAREWRKAQREHILSEIVVGEIRAGTVSNLADFGAFVDIGGMDGLVHISEIAWSRLDHPSQALSVGDSVQVYVLNVDHERQRVGLSVRRTLPDPWQTAISRYPEGTVIRGTVSHVASFGVFVRLEPGIEGLVHSSELESADDALPDILSEGDSLHVVVLSVDGERHRIALSLSSPAISIPPEEPAAS